MPRRNVAAEAKDGPSSSPRSKKVRSSTATNLPTTSRVGSMELRDRIGTWWMNPRMADVHFNVGPPGGVPELVPAHILVVAPASVAFNAMFLGSFDVRPTIDVPDGDPDAFKEMLRYIYTDRAMLTVGNVSDLLYLAKKYLLSRLIEQIVDCLKTNIGCDNFSAVYQEAALHEEIREVCMDFIANYSTDLFVSDYFFELDFDVMRKVAVRSLAVDTLTFYRKLLGWAQEECERRSVDASTANMRCILADAFKLIRFVALSPEEYEQGPGSDELLTMHEKAVLHHWHAHGNFSSLIGQKPVATFRSFASAPDFLQGMEGICVITERQALVDAIENSPIVIAEREGVSLEFETDKCIFFSGIVCSFRRHWSLGQHKGLSLVTLDTPVLVQAHRKCTVTVQTSGTMGALTRSVTQVIGRELEKPDDMIGLLRGGESNARNHTEPDRFTLSYGSTRRVFAEILYRYVDDTIYGV